MSHDVDRRVGQKLYFAHIHLRELEKLAELASAGAVPRQMAYTESFSFHLKGALNCYLAELASYYKVDTSPEQSLEPILLLLAHRGVVSPEFNELHTLAAVHDSWMKRLDAFYRACNEGSGVRIESAKDDSRQHLSIIDLQGSGETEIILPDVIECARWLAAAEELIERQRHGMEQW